MEIRRRGLMLVLSSPSGAGKTTLSRMLLERDRNLCISVSVTTRKPRAGEVHGRDYFFIDPPAFARMVEAGELLEHALVFGNRYGTPKAAVEQMLGAGRDVLFDIDWQGTQQLSQVKHADMVSVFILPPSMVELEARLRRRAEDPDDVVARRLAQVAADVTRWAEYDYVLVNADLEASVGAVRAILGAERLRHWRQQGLTEFVKQFRDVR